MENSTAKESESREKSAGIMVLRGEQVLLVKHGKASRKELGIYGVPSGSVEPGETEEEAAIREFREETGLIVDKNDLQDFPGNLYFGEVQLRDGFHHFEFKVFAAINTKGRLRSTEETIPEWVNIADLDRYSLFLDTKKIIFQVIDYFKK